MTIVYDTSNNVNQSMLVFVIDWQDQFCDSIQSVSENTSKCLNRNVTAQFTDMISSDAFRYIRAKQISESKVGNNFLSLCSITSDAGNQVWLKEELIKSHNGQYQSVFQVLTEEHETEKVLVETKNRLELVLEGTRLGMWDWNPQTNDVVFDIRWAEMLGIKWEDMQHSLEDWQSRVHPDDIDGCFADITAHMEGKTSFYENTHRMMHTDGKWRYILDRGRIVERDENGQPIRFTGTHTDVTPLKEAELQAKVALEARNRFFATISHEIRTPLHGIMATVEVLDSMLIDNEQRELVGLLSKSGGILMALLNDLLDVSKINEGALKVHKSTFDLLPVLNHSVALFSQKASEKGITLFLKNETQKSHVFINSDELRVGQIIANILSNAVKFTQQGKIALQLKLESGDVILKIIDTGEGIEDVNKVFEFYEQESSSTTIQGTGIGLSLVKSLCENLDIKMTCQSTLGVGTEFEFNFGEILQPPVISKIEGANNKQVKQFTRALLVDDNPINLIIGKKILSKCIPTLDTCESGQEALALLLQNEPYQIIFMDLNMPGWNGYQTLQEIIKQLNYRPIIIAQTADASEQTQIDIEQSEFDGIIQKPYNFEAVEKLLNRL